MNRRDALKYMANSVGAIMAACSGSQALGSDLAKAAGPEQAIYAGWRDDPTARRQFIEKFDYPYLNQINHDIRGTGKDRQVFLWKMFEEVTGSSLIPHNQAIGDCTSHAWGLGVDILTCVAISLFKRPEQWIAPTATEIIYAGSRVEVGGGIRGDGSTGSWCAEFVQRWGCLLRQKYPGYDFSTYSGSVAKKLGRAGVPDELEPLTKQHPVKTCTLVQSWEECRDAVANGYPVAMCSNVGFKTTRDTDGFLRRSRRPWYHAMLIAGVDDKFRRPGGLIVNSWGSSWCSGPTRHGQPAGSFWCDASTIDAAMRQGDSFALSDYVGYPRRDIPDYTIW